MFLALTEDYQSEGICKKPKLELQGGRSRHAAVPGLTLNIPPGD